MKKTTIWVDSMRFLAATKLGLKPVVALMRCTTPSGVKVDGYNVCDDDLDVVGELLELEGLTRTANASGPTFLLA